MATAMELTSENSEPSAGSLPAAERKDTFGMFSPPSPDLEQSSFGMPVSLPPESEEESGKHIILYRAIFTSIPYF